MSRKISLIIPVYNSEQYVEKCILSCVNQDLHATDYEILVINDGSTDNSLNIIQNIAKDSSNIVVVDKPNSGASAARNIGLNLAKGKYIWFIDSDDWIESNCLNSVFSLMENERLDALQISYYTVNNGFIQPSNEKYRKPTQVLNPKVFVTPDIFAGGTCGTIFKRDISEKHNIWFDESLQLAEDQLFFLSVFYHSKRVKRENLYIYYYNKSNSQSIIQNLNEEQILTSISKIASYRFRDCFKKYCDYIIFNQFLILLNFPSNKLCKIHFLMKSVSLDKKLKNSLDNNNNKRIFLYYSYLGFLFLIIYYILKVFFQNIKDFYLKLTSDA